MTRQHEWIRERIEGIAKITEVMSSEPKGIDDIAADTGLSGSQVNESLVLMKLDGTAQRLPKNMFRLRTQEEIKKLKERTND